jgi:NADPH-dependent curcumin reductase CurA
MMGWREYFTAPVAGLQKLPNENVPTQAYLGVLGMPGTTAWAGLLKICEPKPGETVFVSGAAGAVGSIVAQIAKLKGCAVVASAGTDEKCAWLKSRGVDAAINYKTCGNLLNAVRAAAPNGIDCYFDNVGGEHLEVALEVARPFARFAECGMIAQYNDSEARPGPRNMVYIVGKSIKIQGFLVYSFWGHRAAFLEEMTQWIKDGAIVWEETIAHGIDQAPQAFLNLFTGANTGKMLVKLT